MIYMHLLMNYTVCSSSKWLQKKQQVITKKPLAPPPGSASESCELLWLFLVTRVGLFTTDVKPYGNIRFRKLWTLAFLSKSRQSKVRSPVIVNFFWGHHLRKELFKMFSNSIFSLFGGRYVKCKIIFFNFLFTNSTIIDLTALEFIGEIFIQKY